MKQRRVATAVIVVTVVVIVIVAGVGIYFFILGGEGGNGGSKTSTENLSHVGYEGTLCYLGSLGMCIKHEDPSITSQKLCVYAGGTDFACQIPEGVSLMEAYTGQLTQVIDISPSNPTRTILQTTTNLGYELHVGYQSTASPHILFSDFLNNIPEANEMQFTSEDEAFNFLKQKIDAGTPFPVFVWIAQPPSLLAHAIVVSGYDDANVYYMDPNIIEEQQKSRDSFLQVWGTGHQGGPYFGPYFLMWVEKTGTEKTASEMVAYLKDRASNAPANILSYANRLEGENETILPHLLAGGLFNTIYWYRSATATFLQEQGYTAVAAKYMESANKAWAITHTSPEPTSAEKLQALREIATLENEAYNLWS